MFLYHFRFINISSSLPATSNVKMIEIWMLFCLFLPFLEVLLQTYIKMLDHDADKCQELKPMSRVEPGVVDKKDCASQIRPACNKMINNTVNFQTAKRSKRSKILELFTNSISRPVTIPHIFIGSMFVIQYLYSNIETKNLVLMGNEKCHVPKLYYILF